MNIVIQPKKLQGTINAIPSKSQTHRFLICAAFSDNNTRILCPQTNRDIEATAQCLRALGASIQRTEWGFDVTPISQIPSFAVFPCGESGSTLRFMLPIAGALGVHATFLLEGRLSMRPLSPLWEEMERMGCVLSRPTADSIQCSGRLQPGKYIIDGSISSQFITGLLFATSLIHGECEIEITGKIESKPYIDITKSAMELFHAPHYHSPGNVQVEGDWSNSAFFLCANTLGSNVQIENLNIDSFQGDRVVLQHLEALESYAQIDVSQTPDLVPVLAVVAAANHGARFCNAGRLRLKETDRLETTAAMILGLGGKAEILDDSLLIHGTGLHGGTVDATHDHRIAMSAAIAATVCESPVTIINAHEVEKSYPRFWEDYEKLGGNYEQYIRR